MVSTLAIPARSSVVLKQVPNGIRYVAFASPGVPRQAHEVSVPPRQRGRLRVLPVLGSARLFNDTGVAMRLRLGDRKLGRLEPGRALETGALPAVADTFEAVTTYTAAIAAIVTGPRRQYAPLYRYCHMSSMRLGSRPTRSGSTWSSR